MTKTHFDTRDKAEQICRTASTRTTNSRSGLTLIEVLIATTITLLMMLALAQGFKTLSESVSAGRSKLSLSDQLRGISSLLRNDLEGITVDSNNPQSSLARTGYFKYYDGPLSDTSATLFNYLPTGAVEQRIGANRWGDLDDILMFTSKAKDGEWFRGKVPKAMLLVDNLNKGMAITLTAAQWNEAWQTDVSIASQYAEIAWFMRPLQGSDSSASAPPNRRYPIHLQELLATGYGVPPETAVEDVAPGVDITGDLVPDPDGMPDRIALCRRVLLIRPDLDISETTLSSPAFSGKDPQLVAKPLPIGTAASVNSFRYCIRFAYQRCDLSVRAFANDFVAANGELTLQTNSLADLQRPENRFAHYTIPLPAISLAAGTSLPLLALTSEATSSGNYLALTNQAYGKLSASYSTTDVLPTDRGFIPSCFFRSKITLDAAGNVGSAVPTLEEIVASNVVAFDVKGYDLSVKLIANRGVDGAWGAKNVDDDQNGTTDDATESGWPGTDDLVLTPSDPGYSMALINASPLVTPSETPQFSNSGAFVDIDWSRKVIHAPHRLSSGTFQLGMTNTTAFGSFWSSNLSCLSRDVTSGNILPPKSMARSGAYFAESTNGVVVYQPCFDTFTDAYESDGEYMQVFDSNELSYVAWRDGMRRFGFTTTQDSATDKGTDGLGNDDNERETSPPIPYKLPSVQATIRVQDYPAGTLQQISVVHSLR
jgi:hypothetical protein